MKFGNDKIGIFIFDRLGEICTTSLWVELFGHLIVIGVESRPLDSPRYLDD